MFISKSLVSCCPICKREIAKGSFNEYRNHYLSLTCIFSVNSGQEQTAIDLADNICEDCFMVLISKVKEICNIIEQRKGIKHEINKTPDTITHINPNFQNQIKEELKKDKALISKTIKTKIEKAYSIIRGLFNTSIGDIKNSKP